MKRKFKPGRSYDLLGKYSWYTPDFKGILAIVAMMVLGFFIAEALGVVLIRFAGEDFFMTYGQMIIYPVMFIPAMMYCSGKSCANAVFDKGYALDSANFAPNGGFVSALVATAAVVSVSYLVEPVYYLLPEMGEKWKAALDSLVDGPLWVTLLSVSVFAPFFEEWLCRGMILRGLLHHVRPSWAIVISSLFFAVLHMNPWQGIPAFLIGCLFGYVYYRTGSLKLTMLMHFVNNTISAFISRIDAFEDADTYYDVIPDHRIYFVIYAAMLLIAVLSVMRFSRTEMKDPAGNCDVIPSAEEMAVEEASNE